MINTNNCETLRVRNKRDIREAFKTMKLTSHVKFRS